eukprot:1189779-Pleurochrysis_carterae.AAC.1
MLQHPNRGVQIFASSVAISAAAFFRSLTALTDDDLTQLSSQNTGPRVFKYWQQPKPSTPIRLRVKNYYTPQAVLFKKGATMVLNTLMSYGLGGKGVKWPRPLPSASHWDLD